MFDEGYTSLELRPENTTNEGDKVPPPPPSLPPELKEQNFFQELEHKKYRRQWRRRLVVMGGCLSLVLLILVAAYRPPGLLGSKNNPSPSSMEPPTKQPSKDTTTTTTVTTTKTTSFGGSWTPIVQQAFELSSSDISSWRGQRLICMSDDARRIVLTSLAEDERVVSIMQMPDTKTASTSTSLKKHKEGPKTQGLTQQWTLEAQWKSDKDFGLGTALVSGDGHSLLISLSKDGGSDPVAFYEYQGTQRRRRHRRLVKVHHITTNHSSSTFWKHGKNETAPLSSNATIAGNETLVSSSSSNATLTMVSNHTDETEVPEIQNAIAKSLVQDNQTMTASPLDSDNSTLVNQTLPLASDNSTLVNQTSPLDNNATHQLVPPILNMTEQHDVNASVAVAVSVNTSTSVPLNETIPSANATLTGNHTIDSQPLSPTTNATSVLNETAMSESPNKNSTSHISTFKSNTTESSTVPQQDSAAPQAVFPTDWQPVPIFHQNSSRMHHPSNRPLGLTPHFAMNRNGTRALIGTQVWERGNHTNQTWQWIDQVSNRNANEDSVQSQSVALSADAKRVAVACQVQIEKNVYDSRVEIFQENAPTKTKLSRWAVRWVQWGSSMFGEHTKDCNGLEVALSADGKRVALTTLCGTYLETQVWQNTKGKDWKPLGDAIRTSDGRSGDGGIPVVDGLFAMDFSGDGSTLAVAGVVEVHLYRYDSKQQEWRQLGDIVTNEEHSGMVIAVSLSYDGNRLAVATPSAAVYDYVAP